MMFVIICLDDWSTVQNFERDWLAQPQPLTESEPLSLREKDVMKELDTIKEN